jgi:hypothetical protein
MDFVDEVGVRCYRENADEFIYRKQFYFILIIVLLLLLK